MEWKHGKSGRTGRTVRSRFSQIKGKRIEGLLIHSSAVSSPCEENQNGGEVITYSLGKQNRWLLPEVIKTGCAGFEEEVVLVERYTNTSGNKHTRADCISVFDSKNGTFRKPRRKLAHAKDLLRDDEQLKSRYEVTYPHPSGSWSKRSKRPAGHLGKRKKNTSTSSWLLDDDYDDNDDILSETENSDSEFQDEFGEQLDRSSRLDLNMLIETHCGGISTSKGTKNRQHEQIKPTRTGKCFNVENDEEMQQMHLEFLAQIKAGLSLLDARDHAKNSQNPAVRKQRCRQAKKPVVSSVADSKLANESVPLVKTCSDPDECFSPNSDEGIVLTLRQQEVTPETLAQQWRHMYKEGASYPRTFALNLTSLIPFSNGKEVFIVFRVLEDHTRCHSSQVKAFVSMVVYNDDDYTERTLSDFISQIKVKESDQKIWTIQDIADMAICFHSELANNKNVKVDCKEPRKPRLSLDVFVDLFGWRSKTYSSHAAKLQVKRCVTEVTGHPTTSTTVPLDGHLVMEFCEICFQDMQDQDCDATFPFLSLNACGHRFCNSCWGAYLKTQIDLGHTYLRCPGHECNVAVDDVTLMSLVPWLYGRHLAKRVDNFLELNPEWKWCPADQCKLVVKATIPQDSSKVCDAEHNGSVQPVPVACVCGTMWCFKCQEDAHWPATCEEAQVFRQKNASYARLVTRKEKELITSVQVKRCPSCYYPVEKGLGCNHMRCIFCRKEFCWCCLKNWSDHYAKECRLVQRQKIQLPTKYVNVLSYQHVAVSSRVARTSSLICRIHRKLDKIEEGLQIYTKRFPLKPELNKTSCTEKRLNMLCENNATQFLKKVFNFKFQANLALEGLAIRLSFSHGTICSKRLAVEFSRLLFIVERMDEVLRHLDSCLVKKDSLFKLKHFVKFGKECIVSISRTAGELH